MRRLTLGVLVLALHALPRAQAPQNRPQQADGVVRLLADLESALSSAQPEAFRAIASSQLPARDAAVFDQMREGEGRATAVIRERDRRPDDAGYVVLADLLVSHGFDGRVATWQIVARPTGGARDRFEITGLKQLAVVDGLLKLALDRAQPFAVHNLVLAAPDLTVKFASGSAFVAQSEAGRSVLVLRGSGELHFVPPDEGEQDQLRIAVKRPRLDVDIDAAFVRLDPSDVAGLLSDRSLVPVRPDPAAAVKAQDIFDRFASRTFNLNLSDLSSDRWSLLPQAGNVAVEFRSRRYGWLTYTRSANDAEDVSLFDRDRGRNLSVYASAQKLATRGRFYDEDADAAYDVLRYGLDLTFDPGRSWISGRGRLHVKIVGDAVRTLSIRLADSLAVSSVSSPEFGRLLAMRVIGQTSILVNLPASVSRGQEVTLDVAYSGRLESQELSHEAMAPGGQVPEPGRSQPEFQTPEPRFMFSNRVYWYPQAPTTHYALAAMRLTVPSEYQIIASGSLLRSSVAPVETPSSAHGELKYGRTADYFADRPVRYLSCVISRFVPVGRATAAVPAVAPSTQDVPAGSPPAPPATAVDLEVIATPRRVGVDRQLAARAANMVKFYATLTGEAPYPNLTVAVADALLPGGHSPAFMSLIQRPLPSTPYGWQNDPLAFDRFPDFLMAHEIAHQWWGQAVGFKNYHEQWLSEGLAQYSAVMFLGAEQPGVVRSLISEMRQSAAPLVEEGPIYLGYRLGHIENRGNVFRAIVYNKSAVVLHMLRRLIGDEAFTRGLRRFYHDWRFKKAGTDDLRASFELEAGRPLGRFFDRWILESRLPRLRVTSRVEPGGQIAVVRVEQVGVVFDLPLTVSVQYADGRSDDVSLAVTDAVVEQHVPLRGVLRRIIAKDDLTFATMVN